MTRTTTRPAPVLVTAAAVATVAAWPAAILSGVARRLATGELAPGSHALYAAAQLAGPSAVVQAVLAVPLLYVVALLASASGRALSSDDRRAPAHVLTAALLSIGTGVAVAAPLALPLAARSPAGGLGTPSQALVAVGLASLVAPWRARALLASRPQHRQRAARRRGVALVGSSALLLAGLVPAVTASAQAATPAGPSAGAQGVCPSGVPLKHFDATAIDVDIPLNRFGDHDPAGHMYVLNSQIAAVRAEEKTRQVSTGLAYDPIQPLVIRANMGDCVEIGFTNDASGGEYGVHIDGLNFGVASSGDGVGRNASSAVPRGGTATYRFWVPRDVTLEGAHYLHPGPGNRSAVSHGLFGSLSVQPPGSTYTSITTGEPIESGWEASIVPGTGKAFREYVELYHEVGTEDEEIMDARGDKLPRVDPHTESYRPGARAMNYRSEPFLDRLDQAPEQEAHAYGSYTFGDPATIMPRGYLGDPTKIRILHAGSEMFHVFHLHGGGIRWRLNPHADTTYQYDDTGLNKFPKAEASPSTRLDSQAFGPGESYDLEIEGGAGGVQQVAGDFLFHCHIAEHYVSGMWSFWRVYNTRQPDLVPLPDRAPLPAAVTSDQLLGRTMPDGTTLTAANLDAWIRPQLAPQGVRRNDQDATVWNWAVDTSDAAKPVYLGEPEDTSNWPDLPRVVPGHPGDLIGDTHPTTPGLTDRPKMLFDPTNGRIAYPLMRPHIGMRPPFSPNGHSGAPWLGEQGGKARTGSGPDPWAGRADGLCPQGASIRHFNVAAIQLPIQVTRKATDPLGKIYVLAKYKADTLSGKRPAEPLAIRTNIGECDAVTLVNEQTDAAAFGGFSQVNMHIHHVQFDTQASDGVITGMQYEQAVRPYKDTGMALTQDAAAGDTVLHVAKVGDLMRPGVFVGVGLGTEGIEQHAVASVDASAGTVTLATPLTAAHRAGEWAGDEFTQYRWYPDVLLDNIFWHDHVDGIHSWGHGMVGQLIVEPKGSTYHDPKTGEQTDSGTIVDIHTTNPLISGVVNGSFREMALWTLDENPVTDSTLNLRAEPFADRGGDPSLRFSSYTHGDPVTPLPQAYAGDPFVIRTINVGPSVDTLHVDGHRFFPENRYIERGQQSATPEDSLFYGISEKYTLVLQGGAGGPQHKAGDYLYMNGIGRRFRQGAWGLIRVLSGSSADLKPLPGRTLPDTAQALPAVTGGRPPVVSDPGNPCPAGSPVRAVAVSAVDLPDSAAGGGQDGRKVAFVPSAQAQDVIAGRVFPQPLALHAAVGECVKVTLTNLSHSQDRVSFDPGMLLRDSASSGINAGFDSEQTVARDQSRTYVYFADEASRGSTAVSDYGGDESGTRGLYGAVVVSPQGATFTDPVSGAAVDTGTDVDVHLPDGSSYRDFTVVMADDDPVIGGSFMPYPRDVSKQALINYRTAPRNSDLPDAFSGTPETPLLQAYAGDPLMVHAVGAPGDEQMHVFNLGGMSFGLDGRIHEGQSLQSRGVGPYTTVDAAVRGGAGGSTFGAGDFFYGDLRRPFTEAGMWGIIRVLPRDGSACPIKPIDGETCGAPAAARAVLTTTSAPSSVVKVGERVALADVVVRNAGSDMLDLGPTTVTGTDADQFAITLDRCGTAEVSPGATCTVEVEFRPTSAGVKNATLVLDRGTAATPLTVPLTGTAEDVAPPPPPPPPPPPAPTDTTAPTGTVRASTTVVSPNGDGRLDALQLTGTFSEKVTWAVTLRSGSTAPSTLATGTGTAMSATWSARTRSGRPVPDGLYTWAVTAKDDAGNPMRAVSGTVRVDSTRPALGAVTATPTLVRPALSETTRLAVPVSEAATVRIDVANRLTGRVYRTLVTTMRGAGTASVTWNGRFANGVAFGPGLYALRATAVDPAGNVSAVSIGSVRVA